MTDDVVERVARAICACSCIAAKTSGVCPGCTQWDDIEAKAALAALKPGDDLPNGLHVETSQFWRGVSDENNMLVARRAAKEMRERAQMTAIGCVRPKDKSSDYCDGYFQGRKDAADEIRALSVEPNNE